MSVFTCNSAITADDSRRTMHSFPASHGLFLEIRNSAARILQARTFFSVLYGAYFSSGFLTSFRVSCWQRIVSFGWRHYWRKYLPKLQNLHGRDMSDTWPRDRAQFMVLWHGTRQCLTSFCLISHYVSWQETY